MAGGKEYPTPIHGTPKFDDFTEIDNPVDFEKLRGESPLFSDKGEGRFFFQRDGVSYHFVDRWSGLTSYAEIQSLAEMGLYGENVCQSLQNTFNHANDGVAHPSSRVQWPHIAAEYCWLILGDVGNAEPPYLAKGTYPVIRRKNTFCEISPMWLQKMGFNSLPEAQEFCSTGYLDRDDQQDSLSGGFESSYHYYYAKVISSHESQKDGDNISVSSSLISTLVKWALKNLEQAEFLNGKDYTNIESAHIALQHQLNSQAEVEEFQALDARDAADYERLKGAVSGEWKSADDYRKGTEISEEMIAEDYYLWLDVQDDWPLPPYNQVTYGQPNSEPTQQQLQQASQGEKRAFVGTTINSMRKQNPENNLLSDSWNPAVNLRQSLLRRACKESFLKYKSLYRIMAENSFDYLWQAKIVEILNDSPKDISEVIEIAEMPDYPPTPKNQGRLWKKEPSGLAVTILVRPSISEIVDFIYHNQQFSNIASIDFVNRTIELK